MSDLRAVESVEVVESTPQRVAVRVHRRFSASTVQQTVTLDAGRPGRDRDAGRLARATDAAQARLPARRARRPGRLGDPVRPRPPPDARQHLLGRRPVRDLRTSLGARRRARLRGRGRQRRHLRPRHRSRTRDDGGTTTTSGSRCCAPRSSPTPSADQGEHVPRSRCVVGATHRRRGREGYRAQPAAAAGRRRQARSRRSSRWTTQRSSSRRSSSPRTGAATSSCGSTRRTAAGPQPGCTADVRPVRRSPRPTCWRPAADPGRARRRPARPPPVPDRHPALHAALTWHDTMPR